VAAVEHIATDVRVVPTVDEAGSPPTQDRHSAGRDLAFIDLTVSPTRLGWKGNAALRHFDYVGGQVVTTVADVSMLTWPRRTRSSLVSISRSISNGTNSLAPKPLCAALFDKVRLSEAPYRKMWTGVGAPMCRISIGIRREGGSLSFGPLRMGRSDPQIGTSHKRLSP
jgi:hypothetical protein